MIDNLLKPFNRHDYQRENFEKFLKHIKFSYSIPSVHIAGTNGKGSAAHYIASIYQKGGYHVGLFSSPALFQLNEMITIDGKMIDDDIFIQYFHKYEKDFIKFDLSTFEIETFIALTYFNENHLDLAVVECGMGGEIDATNIFTPILSIITTVSLEHTEYLGHTYSEVAQSKAGIIKEDVPVIVGNLHEDAFNTIINVAKDNSSPLITTAIPSNIMYHDDGYTFSYPSYPDLKISSLARYSVSDALFALECVNVLKDRFSLDRESIYQGLKEVHMPVRMQIMQKDPLVIIDGGHNPEAIEQLCHDITNVIEDKPLHIIFACFRDKNLTGMLSHLGSISDDLVLTTFDHPRTRKEEEYFLFLSDYRFHDNAFELLKEKLEAFKDDAILICGSLAFASYMAQYWKK